LEEQSLGGRLAARSAQRLVRRRAPLQVASPTTRPRFRSYVVERHHPSYRYSGDVRVGAELPTSGVTYYDVPREYGVTQYRYTVVNDRTVLVDPRSHRIIQVVE